MTDDQERSDDAITSEEMNATVLPGHSGEKALASSKNRNACSISYATY